jgi:hypothetical protein
MRRIARFFSPEHKSDLAFHDDLKQRYVYMAKLYYTRAEDLRVLAEGGQISQSIPEMIREDKELRWKTWSAPYDAYL